MLRIHICSDKVEKVKYSKKNVASLLSFFYNRGLALKKILIFIIWVWTPLKDNPTVCACFVCVSAEY